jgi:hypothetical protein
VLVWPPRGHRVRRRRVAFFSHLVVVFKKVSPKSVNKKQVSSGYLLLSPFRMIDFRGGTWQVVCRRGVERQVKARYDIADPSRFSSLSSVCTVDSSMLL